MAVESRYTQFVMVMQVFLVTNMILIVQEILVEWSKASRGGKGAALRNAVPEALLLLEIPALSYPLSLVHQKAQFSEHHEFRAAHTEEAIRALIPNERLEFRCAKLRLEPGQVSVTYSHSGTWGGAPVRHGPPRKIALLPGAWARIRFNGRFSYQEVGWTYHKTVLNIGFFDQVSADIFLTTEPSPVHDDMAELW